MMKKVTLYISGNVQRVGYRAKVISIATTLDIKGFIQNTPDGRVKIIARGEDITPSHAVCPQHAPMITASRIFTLQSLFRSALSLFSFPAQ